MDIDLDDVKKAYLYLKSYAYHENLNLFLKQRIAEFESEGQADHFIEIVNVIKDGNIKNNENLIRWFGKVNFHVLPKSIDIKGELEQNEHNKRNGLFISNVRDADIYQISKVNYFINAPVQLHIIDMLWCVFAAPAIETLLEDNSYGNRMHPSAIRYAVAKRTSGGQEIFKRYIDQYNLWRDQAVSIATDLSKEEHDVALLSLDLKSYFYFVDVDFDKIKEAINRYYSQSDTLRDLSIRLTDIIDDLYSLYNKITNTLQKKTHPNCINKKRLPIGLASSSIIANWYLSDFDKSIADEVRPAYYGRYVDDILMVFKRPKLDMERPIDSFVDNYLAEVLLRDTSDGNYAISVNNNLLPVQKDKLILQFFDKAHSRAGLEVFKQELDERSSAFKFLPSEHIEKELDKFAYDVLYDGSANKLRSIVGLAENETELAKYLTSHITAHRLCKLDKNSSVLPQLKQFFKGQNALRFHRLWEKIYQYSLVTKNYSFATSFHHYVIREVSKVEGAHTDKNIKLRTLSMKLIRDLKYYNELSLAITVGLLDLKSPVSENESLLIGNAFLTNRTKLSELVYFGSDLHEYSWQFRCSNLIRHHLVAWPLLNYSNFNGDLSSENGFMSGAGFSLEQEKINFSPRFIHYDEW
ncbi:TPA: RNA-directed DNA polymerase, partial [Klebsiella pneumoniae]|nr:RNA-directed DNA polymerase [Klebsiella pneumoniae]